MNAQVISRSEDNDIGLDRQRLAAAGLEHLRQLCGARWTDHNLHDPGITALELLAYALTDLSYRASLPVEDLLASGPSAVAGQFFGARDVLPNRALTALDYRKLLIDLPGVKNAWVLPHAETAYADVPRRELRTADPGTPGVRAVPIRGLFRALLEYMDDVTTQARRAEIDTAARALLQANRNLCEDFVAVDAIAQMDCAVCAEIELEVQADVTQVAAQMLFALQQELAPAVANYSLAEMLARRHTDGTPFTADEIFDGPLLAHGFIDDTELQACELRSQIRLSDLLGVVMDLDGVRAVRDMVVSPLDALGDPLPVADAWRIPVTPQARPRLSLAHGRLVFYKRGLLVAGWNIADAPQAVATQLAQLQEAARVKLETPRSDDLAIPAGRARNLAGYKSFQLEFPTLYGLGDTLADLNVPGSLISPEDHRRRALALQFKAYLLLFDQVLANHLAQLAQAASLLSVEPARLAALATQLATSGEPAGATPHTYAVQLVRSLPAYARVYAAGVNEAQLAAAGESLQEALARHNRFLDHLLARVGEDFAAYAAIVRSAFGGGDAELAQDKCAFLSDCAPLTAARAVAYDKATGASQDRWNSANVSAFERRLGRLLGIADVTRRNLATVSYDLYAEVDSTPSNEFRFRVRHRVSDKILLSSSKNHPTQEAAQAEMIQAIQRAQAPQGYQRLVASDGRPYFNIVDAQDQVIARRIEYFASAQDMEDAIADLIAYLRQHYSGEGFYVIEGLLLRLLDADDVARICPDPGCTDCSDDDPFSYRLQVVLPAFAGRFQHMEFRRFVEDTIRREAPAHLLLKVCWVGPDDMAAIEGAYRDWITLGEGASPATRRTATQALRDVLARSKNVYPPRALFDCTSEEEKPYFVLGRAALGSAATPT